MKKIILILLSSVLLFPSCQYLDKQVPSKETLLEKELKSINWKEVDEFPSVAECETISDKSKRQQCFFDFLTQIIQQKLSIDTLVILYPQLDTINVKVTVFPNSSITFDPQIDPEASYDTATIVSIIQLRLVDFPQIKPAIKRGIPVKTQFVLPVILKVE